MLACVDVDYRPDNCAAAACIVFPDWDTDAVTASHVSWIEDIEAYRPGEFYRRELPCILRVLTKVTAALDVIIIDGYVTLDAAGRPGLGARLHHALEGKVAVVGVAKTEFRGATAALSVLRGTSKTPLWVTAIGMDPAEAARHIRRMHGPHRIPTVLRLVDRVAREAVRP